MDSDIQKMIDTISGRAQSMTDEVNNLTATASDAGELVTATCAPGGRLIDIQFDAKARRLDTHELRDAILDASNAAGAEADARLQSLMDELTKGFAPAGGMNQIFADFDKQIAEVTQAMEAERAKVTSAAKQNEKPETFR